MVASRQGVSEKGTVHSDASDDSLGLLAPSTAEKLCDTPDRRKRNARYLAERMVRTINARNRQHLRSDGFREKAELWGDGIRYLYITPHSMTLLLGQHDGEATWSCDVWTVYTPDESTALLALEVSSMSPPDCHVEVNRVDYAEKIAKADTVISVPTSASMIRYICQAQPGILNAPPPVITFLRLVEPARQEYDEYHRSHTTQELPENLQYATRADMMEHATK